MTLVPEINKNKLEKPSHPIKSGSNVTITHFEDFESIFVRDASFEVIEKLNTLNKQLLKYYRKGISIINYNFKKKK